LKNLFKNLIYVLFIFLFLFSCDYKRESIGDFEKIVVFADSAFYDIIRTDLERTFDQFVYTPQSERSFYLDLQPLEMLPTYMTRRNLLFACRLDASDSVSSYVQRMLSPEVKEAVSNGKVFHIFQENLFADEQMGIILAAPDEKAFLQKLATYSEDIYKKLESYYFERLERSMFIDAEQTALENYLAKNFGWKIRVQYDYNLVIETEDENFVWLRRLEPDRSIFIFRFPEQKLNTEKDWLINLRDSLATVYYEKDSISVEDTYLLRTRIAGFDAIKLVGIWQNHHLILGGPFRTYAFHDPESNFVYIIDISVTAPQKRKKPFLDQLEILANSFQIIRAGS